jgi:hypothetical protein
MVDSRVAERYGRTPADRRRRMTVAVVAAVGVLAVVVAWVTWVGLFSPTATFEVRDTGYRSPDGGALTANDTSVDIHFEVTTQPGTPVSCALQALNEQFGIVGWKVVDLPPAEARTRSVTENVRVTEPAVTGLIYRCWLT